MTQEELLEELRTIRTLLAIDKEDDIEKLVGELSDVQQHILEELSFSEWRPLSSSEIADSFGCSGNKVRNHRSDLVERHLIAKEGVKRGATYRKTGLLRAAEQMGSLGD